MSGLLSRLVDHAAGTPAAVTPRLPGRFEVGIQPAPLDSSPAPGADRFPDEPTVDGSRSQPSVVPGPTRVPARRRTGASEAGASEAGEPSEAAIAAAGDRPSPPPGSPRRREAPTLPHVPTRREPTRTVEVVAVDGEPPDADESGELARSRLPEAAPAPAPAPAPARPVVPALPAPPAATGESRPRREPEPTPDVVHVSIGRVEVRATLAAPAQQPTQKPGPPTSTTEPSPSPREQSPQLDLSAYLRGRRGAR